MGKTQLAISLAITAAKVGRHVYYGTLAGLIDSLAEPRPRVSFPAGCSC